MSVSQISLASIEDSTALQARASTDEATVKAYAQEYRDGTEFDPIVVFRDEAGKLWLGEGHHRTGAARMAGLESIRAEIREGSARDALLWSIASNHRHGKPRTNEDKRRAVVLLLDDPEWTNRSNGAIAKFAGVSAPLVGSIRATRNSLSEAGPTVRVGLDGRQINTGNIGKRAETSALSDAERSALAQDEDTIATSGGAFLAIYAALAEIRTELGDDEFEPYIRGHFPGEAEDVLRIYHETRSLLAA